MTENRSDAVLQQTPPAVLRKSRMISGFFAFRPRQKYRISICRKVSPPGFG